MTRYALHPQVGLREEQFGALAYHFGNRRLTFLNDDKLVAVVRTAADHDDIDAALDAVGIPPQHRHAYLEALELLHRADVLTCE